MPLKKRKPRSHFEKDLGFHVTLAELATPSTFPPPLKANDPPCGFPPDNGGGHHADHDRDGDDFPRARGHDHGDDGVRLQRSRTFAWQTKPRPLPPENNWWPGRRVGNS